MSIPTPEKCGTSEDPLVIIIERMKKELDGFQRERRVLFVEDDLALRVLFERLAEPFNCVVSFAENGNDGLQMALKEPFDLIILDIALPGMDGIEVFESIRRVLGDRPPVTFFTGMLNDHDGGRIEKIGFASFIKKPNQLNERFLASFFHHFGIFRKAL